MDMARRAWWSQLATAWLLMSQAFVFSASAYDLDPDDDESIKSIANDMADDMLTFYHGEEPGHSPGLLELPYYWWYGGAMFGALIDYWYYTGDTKYNAITTRGMLAQVGAERDYMPTTQTLTEGNDDQGFWGLAAMQAAEYNFPDPPSNQPQWLALAQAVFNTQASRWDDTQCGGGLRWQIFTWNRGYDYKNSISQACFFALGARLALFTGNTSYGEWAERTWDWMMDVGFIDSKTYYIIDGANTRDDCSGHVPYLFSYNAGGFLLGAAAMYNMTGSDVWKERVDGLVKGIDVFFQGDDNDIMVEVACEPVDNCNYDQESFKAYLSRWLAVAVKWAPHIADHVQPRLRGSAVAAAEQCTGGANGRMCGIKWAHNNGTWDGTTGLGHQMSALNVVLTQLAHTVGVPVTDDTGGTSQGDPSAGSGDIGRMSREDNYSYGPMTAGQRAGAAILTIAVLAGLLVGVGFMFIDEATPKTMPERWSDFKQEVSEIRTAGAGGLAMLCGGAKRRERQMEEQKGKGPELPTSEPANSGVAMGTAAAVSAVPPPRRMRQSMRDNTRESGRNTVPGAGATVEQRPRSSRMGSSSSGNTPGGTPRGNTPSPGSSGEDIGVAHTVDESTSAANLLAPASAAQQQPQQQLDGGETTPPRPARLQSRRSQPPMPDNPVEPAWSSQRIPGRSI